MTVVALDAMGGDHAPKSVVHGALLAARDAGLEVVLVGRIGELRAHLPVTPANVHLQEAPDAIGMAEQPTLSLRQKPRSSIMVGLDLVARGEAAAFASFGNTGAIMAASLFKLGRVPGVARPALGTLFQNSRGSHTLLLDVGANVNCRPAYLLQFATMGKAYFERVLHHRNPSVGLLNVGEEESKGNQFTLEAYALLKRLEPNFTGNVEGDQMVGGAADIVVTDGFNGNIAVKVSEGVANLLTAQLKRVIKRKWHYVAGAWLLRGAFDTFRDHVDYQRVGGAPLFGVNGPVIIGHGRADAEAVASGVRLARAVGESKFVAATRAAFSGTLPPHDDADHIPASADESPALGAESIVTRSTGSRLSQRP
ncbi:MAG: phosphate acyltransferase PlsX [Dehalococcoidia bacterium]